MKKTTLCVNGHFRLAVQPICLNRRDHNIFFMEALATVELPGIIRIFFEKRNPNEKLLCVYEDARFYSGSDYGAQHPLQKVFEVKVTEPRSFKFKVEIPSNLAGSKLTLVGEHFPPKGYSWGPVSGYLTLKIPLLKILKK